MVITKFIAKSCIVPKIKARNKPDAIKELTHLLFEKKKMKTVGLALDQIMAREATESTGIGRGIAVPHARIPGMKNLACAVGRVSEGLDFLAIDRKPVYLVFLICYPPEQQTSYLNFVATVARLLGTNNHLKSCLEAETVEDMFALMQEISENFVATTENASKKVKTDPKIGKTKDGHADLILLARMQLYQEMLASTRSGKKKIRESIEGIQALVDPRLLKHYDKLMASRAPALVPVEGDTCQGCFIKLPSKFVQQVRQDSDHIHTCMNCSRYIYVV